MPTIQRQVELLFASVRSLPPDLQACYEQLAERDERGVLAPDEQRVLLGLRAYRDSLARERAVALAELAQLAQPSEP